MRPARQTSLVVLAPVVLSWNVWAQGQAIDYARIEILTEKIAPNLYMLSGSAEPIPAIRTRQVAGSACSRARTASSWSMPSTHK